MTAPKRIYANNASTVLTTSITAASTVLTVADTSEFPALTNGNSILITLDDGTYTEIVEVFGKSGNQLTGCLRAREGTTARAFAANTLVENRITADDLTDFATEEEVINTVTALELLPIPDVAQSKSWVVESGDDQNAPLFGIHNGQIWRFINYPRKLYAGTAPATGTTLSTFLTNANTVVTSLGSKTHLIQFTSGANKGRIRYVTAVSATALSWSPALPSAPVTGDLFDIYQSTTSAIEKEAKEEVAAHEAKDVVHTQFVRKDGSTMTGSLILNANATAALGAVTKQQLDQAIAAIPADKYITGLASYNTTTNIMTFNLSGGGTVTVDMTTLIGDAIKTHEDKTTDIHPQYLKKAGGTMTGVLTLSADSVSGSRDAVPKTQAESIATAAVTAHKNDTTTDFHPQYVLESNAFKTFTPGVKSPLPATFLEKSLSGFDAYSSTDFPTGAGSTYYYVGLTSSGVSGRQLQIAANWNTGTASPTLLYFRTHDDAGGTTDWTPWRRILTDSDAATYALKAGGSFSGTIDLNTAYNIPAIRFAGGSGTTSGPYVRSDSNYVYWQGTYTGQTDAVNRRFYVNGFQDVRLASDTFITGVLRAEDTPVLSDGLYSKAQLISYTSTTAPAAAPSPSTVRQPVKHDPTTVVGAVEDVKELISATKDIANLFRGFRKK